MPCPRVVVPPWLTSRRAVSSSLVVFQLVALVLVAVVTLPPFARLLQGDVQIYFRLGRQRLQGLLAYRDFPLEYPPLAQVPFILPHLVALDESLPFDTYRWLFLAQSALFSTAIAVMLAWVAARAGSSWSPVRVLSIYALLVVVGAPLLPWRYDLFPALLTMLALGCVLAGRPTLAGLCLGLGVAAKLYPVVLLPIFGAYYLAARDRPALLRLLLGNAGAILLMFLPFLLVDPALLLSFLRYHQARGVQIESLPAGVLLLGHVLGLSQVGVGVSYGAFHLVSPLADGVARWQPLALCLAFGLVLVSGWWRFRAEQAVSGAVSAASLVTFIVLALLVFIATNKVFSPQFIIWLLPFVPLLRLRYVAPLLAVWMMTIILFPVVYPALIDRQAGPVLLLNGRNLLVVALILWLLVGYLPASVPARAGQRRAWRWLASYRSR